MEDFLRRYRFFLLPILIGLLVGIFAIIFYKALELITELVLVSWVGYRQPLPAGEGGYSSYTPFPERFYLLPLTVALGGLISGILSYFFAPESAGIGTDSAIRAYHRGTNLSIKSSIVKLITSAVTIGTGGVSGREGPIALIGAGIGSSLANLFKLSKKEKRIAIAVGLGSGISAIFKAPLAGAIISAEVFFRKDFEMEALIPSFIASVTSYVVFSLFVGFQPIFSVEVPRYINLRPKALLFYAGLGLLCALFSRIYVGLYYKVEEFFENLKVYKFLKPAVGGFFAGLLGAIIPIAIGNGYGWIQLFIDQRLNNPLLALLGALAVMVGVSLTIGSGGSGGVFGPSVMIGGLLGAFYSLSLNQFLGLDLHTPSFIVVGMVSLFAGSASAPLSTLILIAEMTGGYELLVPAMISVFTTHFLSGERSIFKSQVKNRLESPAYEDELGLYFLEHLKVKEHMSKEPISVPQSLSLEEAHRVMTENLIGGIPVVENGRLVGIITKSDILKVPKEERKKVKVSEVMNKNLVVANPEDNLETVLRIMIGRGIGRLPVVEKDKLVGIITRSDIGKAVRKAKGS